jgi:hypothetical protein
MWSQVSKSVALTLAGFLISCLPSSSSGAIALSGDIELISPPSSVVVHVLESDDLARIFLERQSAVLASNLTVDFTATGTYNQTADLPAVKPVIAAGTVVDSYFIHADNISSQGLRRYDGSVTFDVEILGVILTNLTANKLLSISDGVLGHPGTLYPPATDAARDLELGLGLDSDQLILSADRKTLTFHLATEQSADQLRIVTAPSSVEAVPEPASFTLMLLGVGICAGIRRWRHCFRHSASPRP